MPLFFLLLHGLSGYMLGDFHIPLCMSFLEKQVEVTIIFLLAAKCITRGLLLFDSTCRLSTSMTDRLMASLSILAFKSPSTILMSLEGVVSYIRSNVLENILCKFFFFFCFRVNVNSD